MGGPRPELWPKPSPNPGLSMWWSWHIPPDLTNLFKRVEDLILGRYGDNA
ncbi:hypothetical protein BDV12DRAFT_205108 [Aspergillus spectabilis]